VDGAALVSESAALRQSSGAIQSDTSEIHTSILPHRTDANINRGTARTSVLPPEQVASTTGQLVKPKTRRTFILSLAALAIVITLIIGGYFFFTSDRTTAIESIAVLPFENRSGSADADYLSDGLAESLIYRLSQLPNLKVSPTSSVLRYKGKEVDAQKIGSELGVNAVMSGRMVQRGDNLTISVELVDARTNKLIWGEQYERKLADLLATQREIATAIADKLQLKLSGKDSTGITKRYTESNEAFQLYLKGRFYWNKRTADGLTQAAAYYKQAIEKDPAYALAYSGLAETYVLFPNYSVAAPKDSMPQSKAAALKALELDESIAEAHAALGTYLSGYGWDQSAAERELRRAIELKPNYPTAYHWLAITYAFSERTEEAIATAHRAEELDPLSLIISADTAFDLILLRRYDEAIAQGQKTLKLDPNFYYVHYLLGWAYIEKGLYSQAIAECRESLRLNPEPWGKGLLAVALAKSGARAEAMKLRDDLKGEIASRYVASYFVAIADTALGEKDEAFAALEKDFAERSTHFSWIPIDPLFDDLRADPRFKTLMQKVESSKLD